MSNSTTKKQNTKNNSCEDSVLTKSSAEFDLENYIPFRLVVSQLMMLRSAQPSTALEEQNLPKLSKGDCRILVIIALQVANSPSLIIEKLGMDKTAVTRHIKTLRKLKLIDVKPDPEDMRRKSIFITPLGAKASNAVISVMQQFSQYLDSSISVSEKKTLIKILHKLNRSTQQYQK